MLHHSSLIPIFSLSILSSHKPTSNPLPVHISLKPFIVLLPSNFVSRRVWRVERRRKKNKEDGESSHEIETWNLLSIPGRIYEGMDNFSGLRLIVAATFPSVNQHVSEKQETDLNACPRSLDTYFEILYPSLWNSVSRGWKVREREGEGERKVNLPNQDIARGEFDPGVPE